MMWSYRISGRPISICQVATKEAKHKRSRNVVLSFVRSTWVKRGMCDTWPQRAIQNFTNVGPILIVRTTICLSPHNPAPCIHSLPFTLPRASTNKNYFSQIKYYLMKVIEERSDYVAIWGLPFSIFKFIYLN